MGSLADFLRSFIDRPLVPVPLPRSGLPLLLGLFLLVGLGACGTGGTGNPFDAPRPSSSSGETRTETFRVRAMNPSFNDVTIFALDAFQGGRRIRVGRLSSSQEETFEFRMRSAVRDIRFELDYFTGPTCITGAVTVVPGDLLELMLPAEPRNQLGCR